MNTDNMTIGVLALQGDVEEHCNAIRRINVDCKEVRSPSDLDGVDGLIIPGGESTTIGKMMKEVGLEQAIIQQHKKGMAIWGTCAGAILLAKHVIGDTTASLNLLSISIRRNGYGRQLDSFETSLDVDGLGEVPAVFIRAPVIDVAAKEVTVLASYEDSPVLVQEGNILASTFHPEMTGDLKILKYFTRLCNTY